MRGTKTQKREDKTEIGNALQSSPNFPGKSRYKQETNTVTSGYEEIRESGTIRIRVSVNANRQRKEALHARGSQRANREKHGEKVNFGKMPVGKTPNWMIGETCGNCRL